MARVLRWGPGYTGGEDPLNLLRDVIEAEEIRLDRWTVVFHPEDKPEDQALKAPSNSTGKKKKVHQAHLSQQNQHHQFPAITSKDIAGHLMSIDNTSYIQKYITQFFFTLIQTKLYTYTCTYSQYFCTYIVHSQIYFSI